MGMMPLLPLLPAGGEVQVEEEICSRRQSSQVGRPTQGSELGEELWDKERLSSMARIW